MRWGFSLPALGLGVAACLACAPPAGAAAMFVTKTCFREREPVIFSVFGFTPGGLVDIRRDGLYVGPLTAEANGAQVGAIAAPVVDPARVRPFVLTATDRANPFVTAQVTPSPLSSLFEVRVRPAGGRPGRRRRITARGFTTGANLYAHVRRAGRGRNIRLGALRQPCGTKSVRRRIFRRNSRRGTYKVQFDTFRRYSANRVARVSFRVTVGPAASAPLLEERWVRVGN